MKAGIAVLATASLMSVTVARSARADTEEAIAAEFFQAGSAAFDRKDYKAAARSFEEAYRHVPRAEALLNAALGWDAAGEPAQAADAFSAALARGELDQPATAQARKRLTELEAILGVIGLDAPVGALASVAHADRVKIPARIHVAPGNYTVTVVADGGAQKSAIAHVTAGTTAHLSIDPAVPAHPAVWAPLAAPGSPPPAEVSPPPSVPDRTWAWVALGGAAGLAGAAVGLGVGALNARNAFVNSGDTDAGQHDKAASLQLWTNVAWAAAGLAGAAGVLLLVFPPRESVAGSGSGAELRWIGTGAVLRGGF